MIFRKHNRDEERQEPAEPQTPAADAENVTPHSVGGASLLTADVVMEGNLVTSGDLHLDGTLHGSVQAAHVVIDTSGAVNGQVVAEEVTIHGRVIGPICGVRVHLAPGAQVEGDVLSQSIVVEDGAFIDGQIRHSEDPLGEWQQIWYGEEHAEPAEEAHGGNENDETPSWLRTEATPKAGGADDAATEEAEEDEKKTGAEN